jgi:hypothetical protein
MIEVLEIPVEDIDLYQQYIPLPLQMEYISNEQLFFEAIVQADIPCGAAVFQRLGEDVLMRYFCIDDVLRDTVYEDMALEALIFEMNDMGFQTFLVEYQRMLRPQLHRMLEEEGFTFTDTEGGYVKFRLKDIRQDTPLNGAYTNVISLREASGSQLKTVIHKAEMSYELYVDSPVRKEDYDMECSCLYVLQNEAKGILLLKKVSDAEVVVSMMYTDGTELMAPLAMLRFMTEQIRKKYSEDIICSITALDEKMEAFVKKVTGIPMEHRTLASYTFDKDEEAIDKDEEAMVG